MMEEMLAQMARKLIPPEVLAMLTPEKIKEIGDQAGAAVTMLKESLARIEAKQDEIILLLTNDVRELTNDSNSGKPKRAPAKSGSSGNADK